MSLADDFRNKAKEQRAIANDVITGTHLIKQVKDSPGDPESDTHLDATNLVSAIVGHLNATIYEVQADSLDYLRMATGQDEASIRRRRIMDRNDAIRRAAASGDWTEFDRLAAGGNPNDRTDDPNAVKGEVE